MSRNLLPTVFLMLALSADFGHAADSPIIAPDARLEKLADGFKFTEGPAADGDGNVFFTDQPNDRILKWSTDGKLSTFLQPCGRANGLCFDARGNFWPAPMRRAFVRPSGRASGLCFDVQPQYDSLFRFVPLLPSLLNAEEVQQKPCRGVETLLPLIAPCCNSRIGKALRDFSSPDKEERGCLRMVRARAALYKIDSRC